MSYVKNNLYSLCCTYTLCYRVIKKIMFLMNAYTISHVNSFYFQGKNVLFHCIDWNVDVRVFEAILDKCSASVITQKTPVCVNSAFFC